MSSRAGGSVQDDGKELDPLTRVPSEDLGGSKTDRFIDAMRSKIMHMIDDINGGRGFLTTLRQGALLDTKGVDLTDLLFQQETLEAKWTPLMDRLSQRVAG